MAEVKVTKGVVATATYEVADEMLVCRIPFSAIGHDSKATEKDGKVVPPKSTIHANSGGFRDSGILVGGKMLRVNLCATTQK